MKIAPSVSLLGQEPARSEAPRSIYDTFRGFARIWLSAGPDIPQSKSQKKSVTESPQLTVSKSIPKMFTVFNWISNQFRSFLFQRLRNSSFWAISSMTTHCILLCTHWLYSLDPENVRKAPQALSGWLLTDTPLKQWNYHQQMLVCLHNTDLQLTQTHGANFHKE